jgi:hypothetical protein
MSFDSKVKKELELFSANQTAQMEGYHSILTKEIESENTYFSLAYFSSLGKNN